MPIASGTNTNDAETMVFWRLLPRSGELTREGTIDAAITPMTRRAPAYTSHLICSRSENWAWRKRNTSETKAARPAGRTRPKELCRTLNTVPAGPPIPSGLIEWVPCITPGVKAFPRNVPPRAMPANQATGRHLLDGSVPVGNSNRTNVPVIPMPTPHTQLPSQSDHLVEKLPTRI